MNSPKVKFKPIRRFSTQFLCNIMMKYKDKKDVGSRRIYMKALTEFKFRKKHEDQSK